MFDTKFIVTLTALIVAVIAICNFDNKKVTVTSLEKFGMLPSFGVKSALQSNQGGTPQSLPGFGGPAVQGSSMSGVKKGDFFSVPGTFQAAISPRFANTSFGANILYNIPSNEHMASPVDPLTYRNMARENFTTKEDYGCKTGLCCNKGGDSSAFHGGAPLMDSNFTAGDYQQVLQEARGDSGQFATSMLPVQTMATVDAAGDEQQPIIYDRLMVSNRRSRLRSQGDMIRGDLPIVPCEPGWFRPSVAPNLDLNQGAMNVLAGVNNEVTQALSQLIYSTSGNTDSTIAGVNMTTMRDSVLGAAGADVRVTTFA